MDIARHAQVVSATNVNAELERVVADEFRRVADELELVFVLIERAVATVDAQAGAEVDILKIAVALDKTGEEAGAEVIQVQSRHACVGGRVLAKVEWQHVDFVTEEAEPEVGDQRR